MKKTLLLATFLALGLGGAAAAQQTSHTVTLTWTWPTTRADGSALALSAIGSVTIVDTISGAPGGNAITCSAGTFPPTATTGTCTTGALVAGVHSFTAQVFDTSGDAGTVSAAVSVTVPLSGPAAVANLAAKLN